MVQCLTFHSDLGLAKLAASLVGGFAQVVTGIMLGSSANLYTGSPVREADPGAADRCQLLSVLHPLDLQGGGATDMAAET